MSVTDYSISASTTQVDTKVDGRKGVIIINDGTADVYLSFDTPITVATTGAALKMTDPPLSVNEDVTVLRVVTSSGTATVRVFALE